MTHLDLIVRFCAEYLLWAHWESGARAGMSKGLGPLPQVGLPFPLNHDNVDRIISVQNQVNYFEFFLLLLLESNFEPAPGGDSEIWE